VFVGVISSRSNLCYTGQCLSSLAPVCASGWFRCFLILEGACHVVLSLFLLFCLLFNFACHVFRLTFCVLVFGGPVHLASRSGVGVWLQSWFDLIWFFSGVPGARGALLIWFYSLVGQSLLIRNQESVL